MPDDELTASVKPYTDVPVLFGHYWYNGTPTILSPTAACVDYSAGKGGDLVAYQWNRGGKVLSNDQFVAV